MEEFDTDTFTVVVQPFTRRYSFSKDKSGLTDYSNLSADCFHLSQKENARGKCLTAVAVKLYIKKSTKHKNGMYIFLTMLKRKRQFVKNDPNLFTTFSFLCV